MSTIVEELLRLFTELHCFIDPLLGVDLPGRSEGLPNGMFHPGRDGMGGWRPPGNSSAIVAAIVVDPLECRHIAYLI